jgi:TolA-binding protein
LRQVTLTSAGGRENAFTNTVMVSVQPYWMQLESWRQDLFERQRRELMTRDLSHAPRDDLVSLVNFADETLDLELLERAGTACVAQRKAFTPAQALVFYTIGFRLQHHAQTSSGQSMPEEALRTAVSLSSSNPSLNEKTRLRLAEFLILGLGQTQEGVDLLRTIGARLAPEERRLVELLKGDVLLASGNVTEARKTYLATKGKAVDSDPKQELRGGARLHSALDLIARGELTAGEEVLDSILYERPLERMSPETNLPLISIYLERKEFVRAAATCRRLLTVAGEDYAHEPQILLALATADLALGNSDEGQATLRRLLKSYPESEAAARAKLNWGTRG